MEKNTGNECNCADWAGDLNDMVGDHWPGYATSFAAPTSLFRRGSEPIKHDLACAAGSVSGMELAVEAGNAQNFKDELLSFLNAAWNIAFEAQEAGLLDDEHRDQIEEFLGL